MPEIEELLDLYKEETEKILKAVISEDIDILDSLFNRRQDVIEALRQYDKKDYKKDFLDNILPLEDKLKTAMEEKTNYFKEELLKTRSQRNANQAYNSRLLNTITFNKKI